MPSLRVGSLFGIPIKVGVSFLVVLPLIAYLIGSQIGPAVELLNRLLGAGLDAGVMTAGLLPWLLGTTAAVGLFVGVVLHEFGHALVGRRYGVAIDSITLWFLGGIARFAEFPDDWRHELTIAVAGPAVSLLLGGLCYGMFAVFPASFAPARFVFGYLAVLNVALAGFNLLPGFPMDGGRVLRALLSRRRSRMRATQLAAQVGKGFAVLLGIAGILSFNLFWLAIAFFVYMGASGEARQVLMESALEGLTVGDVMTPMADLKTVTPDTSVETLVDRMVRERHTGYPVLEDGALVGLVTLEDVEPVETDDRSAVSVREVMSTDLVTVSPDTEASSSVTTMQREDVGRLPVVGTAGDLVGLVSRTDLMTVLQVVRQSPSSDVADRATTDTAA